MKKLTYDAYFPVQLDSVLVADKSLAGALEREVEAISQTLSPAAAVELDLIVRANFNDGRVDLFLEGDPSLDIHDYVRLVAETYQQLSPYLHDLQARRSDGAILPLYEQMQRWAYNLLLQKGHTPGMPALEAAVGYARDAILAILLTSFPYDTQFEPWAMLRLRQVCRQAGLGRD
jgi:hypothetical protein